MTSIFSEQFRQMEAQDEARRKAMFVVQIRNAIIQIEEGDTDEAIATLLALIGESPVETEKDMDTIYGRLQEVEWDNERLRSEIGAVAQAIHYPECWDTVTYPTLADALDEMYAWFKCSSDDCPHGLTPNVIIERTCAAFRAGPLECRVGRLIGLGLV